MPTGTGTGVWADGYRDSDGAIVEAKHVRQLGCSPRTPEGLNEGQFTTQFLSPGDEDEVKRYGQAIANPANHTRYLEIDTDGTPADWADTIAWFLSLPPSSTPAMAMSEHNSQPTSIPTDATPAIIRGLLDDLVAAN